MMTSKKEVAAFMAREYPQSQVTIEEVGNRAARVKQPIRVNHLRPGGTVSGPVLMAVADVAMYAAILGEIGLVALAVTTNLSINFFRKPSSSQAIIGESRLMKVGKRLVVGEVTLYSEGNSEPVAHAVGTYSIPPEGN